ncbi:MAG: hypothetical protein PCFJNLEI_00669 [Verrucomicrobiae bacterium]|nr:hypothetical protein [Verrucomicrobiae bacterium]
MSNTDACDLARRAHAEHVRKTGEPYFNHVERVALSLSDSTARAVGYLHDVLEDCNDPALLDELNRFPEPIVTACKLLTRPSGETYFNFIHRVLASGNQTAIAVKIADLKDNLRDLEEGHKKDKYLFALDLLEQAKAQQAGETLDEDLVKQVWKKGAVLPGHDPNKVRKDKCGAWMVFTEHDNRESEFGWEIDRVTSNDHGGSDALNNLRPVHWENVASKSSGKLVCVVTSDGGANVRV